jgi:hypothetical protein
MRISRGLATAAPGRWRRAASRRPDSRPGRRSSRWPCRASRPPVEVRIALRRGREEAAIAQVLAHRQVREQPRVLEDIADAAAVRRHESSAVSTSTRPSTRSAPLSGRISPAMALTSDVLPEPDGPNSAVSPRRGETPRRAPSAEAVADRRRASFDHPAAATAAAALRSEQRRHGDDDRDQHQPRASSPPGTCVKV